MKRLVLLCFLTLPAFGLLAQVSITPNEIVVQNVTADDFEGIGHATVKNLAPQLKTYTWTRNVLEMTDGWESAVCDKNQCYLPHIDSQPFQLGPAEEGLLDVHVYPNDIEGSAVIEVTVTDDNNPNQSATAVYYFNTMPSSTLEVRRDRFRVYPNPTQGIFSLKGGIGIQRIQVYNLAGKLVSAFNSSAGNQYDIRTLPRGSYLVQLIGENGIVATKLIQKI